MEVESGQEVSREVPKALESDDPAESEEDFIEETSAKPKYHLDHCYSSTSADSHILKADKKTEKEQKPEVMPVITTSSSSKGPQEWRSNLTAWGEGHPSVDKNPHLKMESSKSKTPLLSSVFDHPFDPEIEKIFKLIQKRQEREARALAKKSERTLKGRQKRDMAKITAYQLEQSLNKSMKSSSMKKTNFPNHDQQTSCKKEKWG